MVVEVEMSYKMNVSWLLSPADGEEPRREEGDTGEPAASPDPVRASGPSKKRKTASPDAGKSGSQGDDASSDKPFKCEDCPRRFGTKSNMKTHWNSVHEQLRPFACDLCMKKFKTKGNLGTHRKTVHDQKRDYSCHFCDSSFGTRSVLNRHMRNVHRSEPR